MFLEVYKEQVGNGLSNAMVNCIFKDCLPNSPLRTMAVNGYLHCTVGSMLERPDCQNPPLHSEVLQEYFNRSIEAHSAAVQDVLDPDNAPWVLESCVYHYHTRSGTSCYKEKTVWTDLYDEPAGKEKAGN